ASYNGKRPETGRIRPAPGSSPYRTRKRPNSGRFARAITARQVRTPVRAGFACHAACCPLGTIEAAFRSPPGTDGSFAPRSAVIRRRVDAVPARSPARDPPRGLRIHAVIRTPTRHLPVAERVRAARAAAATRERTPQPMNKAFVKEDAADDDDDVIEVAP